MQSVRYFAFFQMSKENRQLLSVYKGARALASLASWSFAYGIEQVQDFKKFHSMCPWTCSSFWWWKGKNYFNVEIVKYLPRRNRVTFQNHAIFSHCSQSVHWANLQGKNFKIITKIQVRKLFSLQMSVKSACWIMPEHTAKQWKLSLPSW